MKMIFLAALCSVFLVSCQKTISDFDPSTKPNTDTTGTPVVPPSGGAAFTATIDGTSINFKVIAATLARSTQYNEKRVDITGVSSDNTKQLTLTLGEETATGNALTVKDYVLDAYPDDDPSTPNIDESLTTQGFSTYGTGSGGNWIYGVYDEKGSFTVTSCDAATTLISGTFATTLTDLNDGSHVVKITAGRLSNVKYTVIN